MESDSSIFPLWTILVAIGGFLILFTIIWCSVLCLISRISGWHRLSQYFAAAGRPAYGKSHRNLSGLIGFASYRGVLTLHTNDEGFFLEVMPLFRIDHPELFIPWSAVTSRSPQKLLWLNGERLTIGAPQISTLTLPARALEIQV